MTSPSTPRPTLIAIANDPLDLTLLAAMLGDAGDMRMANPFARFPFDPEQWRAEFLRPGIDRSYYVGVPDETAPIGHFALRPDGAPDRLRLGLIVTDPTRRGGLGRGIVALAEAEARALGATRLALLVMQDNHRAATLYRRCGYRPPPGDEPAYHGMDRLERSLIN